jgi:hypothetical protein
MKPNTYQPPSYFLTAKVITGYYRTNGEAIVTYYPSSCPERLRKTNHNIKSPEVEPA